MNPKGKMTCEESGTVLVRKLAGELFPEEAKSLESHLAQCASCAAEEQELTRVWREVGSLPAPEIPAELFQKTREAILAHLKEERSPWFWLGKIPHQGVWSLLAPFAAGLVTAGVSFFLVRNLIDFRAHSQHILTALFGLWAALFAGSFWPIWGGKGKKFPLPDAVASFAISITLLTLLISYLSSAVDLIRWPVMSAAYEVALVSNYVFGIGNTFVASWWIYACVASFIGAFIFGFRRGPAMPQKAFLGSFLVTTLLSPAIYLHGSSHGHAYGILVFAALGTFVGALIGIGMGSFIRRQISFLTA